MENTFYTYAYLREDGTPYYIGKGKDRRAFNKRAGDIRPPKDKSRILILTENLAEEMAFADEIYLISFFGRKDLGTGILRNRTNGGEGHTGMNETTRKKISEAHKGKTISDETKKKISEAQKGKTISEKHKEKISEAHKGTTHSEESKMRMSEAKKGEKNPFFGKTHSEETRKKISGAQKGKTHSEEHKKKISEGRKGKNTGKKWWNDGHGNTTIAYECPGDNWKRGRLTAIATA